MKFFTTFQDNKASMRHSSRAIIKSFIKQSLFSGNLRVLRTIVTCVQQGNTVDAKVALSRQSTPFEYREGDPLPIGHFATTCSASVCCATISRYLKENDTDSDDPSSEHVQIPIVLATRACSSDHDVFIWNVIESNSNHNEYVKLLKELYDKEPNIELVKCAILVCIGAIKIEEDQTRESQRNADDVLDYLRIVLRLHDRPDPTANASTRTIDTAPKCVNVNEWKMSEYKIEVVYTK